MKDIKNTPKVSVLMPAYNAEKYIAESIESILNQTFKDFELIIIDDKSKDKSLDIVKIHKDKRITLIKNKENKGSIESYNEGLKNAKGKYIAICTQDDLFHPKRLEIEFDYLEKNPHIFLVGTSATYINEGGKETRRFQKYDDYKMLAWRLRKSNGIIFSSIMFRKTSLLFDGHYEYNFYYKLLKQGKNLTNLPFFLVKYRVHEGAESIYDQKNQEKLVMEVIEKFKDLKDSTNILEKVFYSAKLFFHYIRTMKEKKII